MMKRTKVAAAVSAACTLMTGHAIAQEALDEITVTGIRGSLTNAMDVKRESSGVVDAISAENMGKFPDTNLAESLQRITGVSIDRVEGEGSQVTVRGFAGQFNLVTLNGRQMPAADVQNVGTNDFGASGESRSFDFSVLASEGVTGLQVYKTGRASSPTGGIGATINVNTARPLETGTQYAVGAKLVDDAGSESGDLTPELSGLASWANDDETFGVSLFASYQERDGSSRAGTFGGNVWIAPYDPANGAVSGAVQENEPTAFVDLAGFPSNTRVEYATTHRERTNAMLTLQFAPSDRLTITADALYTVNDLEHNSTQDQQFYARAFEYIEWDGSKVVATPNVLAETHSGTNPAPPFTETGTDILHDNRWVRQRDEMTSVGLNFAYDYNDELSFSLDLASSESDTGGNWPGGWSYYRTPIAGAVSGWRGSDMSRDVPVTLIAITDGSGDQDGIYEVTDVGTQQARREASEQTHSLDQLQLSGSWDNGGNIKVDFGVGRIESEMKQRYIRQGNTLGGWGVSDTGDIEMRAPGIITQACITCKFRDFNFGNTANIAALAPPGSSLITLGEVSMQVNPRDLFFAMAGWVPAANPGATPFDPFNPGDRGTDDNLITEDITSVYLSTTMDGQIGDKDMQVVAGIRWESTDATSATRQTIVEQFRWDSDNDMTEIFGSSLSIVSEDHSYNNLLPSLDISVDLTDEVKARVSFSETIARPQYGFMFVPTTVNDGSTLTYLGGIPTASKGSAKLDPLESTNFDLSVEWYYDESSYASVGYFTKAVSNFVGIEQVPQSLFGLRDVTGRAPGNRLDQAIIALQAGGWSVSEESLFTMTAILDNPADFPGGAAEFDGTGDQALFVLNTYDIFPDSLDPLFIFETAQPVNNQTANIDGFELAWQHFFGDTGFGFMANATLVNGDIKFDNAAPPNFDQFALEGLSDSANLILVWENDTFGARIAYNWRDDFLYSTNTGNFIPGYFEEHGQLDVNFSWNVSESFNLSLDGINLTEEGITAYGRTPNMTDWSKEYDARWVLAARYNFQ
ncbi:MAG: TonB-dependent receptor [Gammaproteobacteria bacterium]|nr:TonB-dependent receptor [Gammaproteobacteria bacterium]